MLDDPTLARLAELNERTARLSPANLTNKSFILSNDERNVRIVVANQFVVSHHQLKFHGALRIHVRVANTPFRLAYLLVARVTRLA